MEPGKDPPEQAPVSCWFCSRRFTAREIDRDGVIRSRRAELGGPYRLFACPQCNRDNICERTKRGRWFASPNLRISIFEYFFSHILDNRPEDFLAAASWFKENEARRRYFFERDGDRRYSGRLRHRFWPQTPRQPQSETRESGHRSEPTGAPDGDHASRKERRRESSPRPEPRRFLAPHEILEVSPGAEAAEIRAAFRRLARKYHPDKVYHLGEEAQRMAHEKFTRLKAAYESLIARDGG